MALIGNEGYAKISKVIKAFKRKEAEYVAPLLIDESQWVPGRLGIVSPKNVLRRDATIIGQMTEDQSKRQCTEKICRCLRHQACEGK